MMYRSCLTASAILFACAHGGYALAETISVPCASYEPGNAWVHVATTDACTVTEETIVLDKTSEGVLLGQKRKSDCSFAPGQAFEDESEILFERKDGALYMVSQLAASPGGTQMETRIPLCGEIPAISTSTMRSGAGATSFSVQQTINVRKLGKEEITVPAGTFDTDVFEAVIRSRSTDYPGANSDQTITVYAADEIGMARVVTKFESDLPVPSAGAAADPQTGQLLQEGIKALMRGENADAVFEQLEQMGQQSPNSLQTIRQTTTILTELQSYHVK